MTRDPRDWEFAPDDTETVMRVAQAASVPTPVARVLVNRGATTAPAARAFLDAGLDVLHDPFTLAGMEAAVERLVAAIRAGERIVVYGDFDVDGTAATTLLLTFFDLLDANVGYYVPRRMDEGYGLNKPALTQLHADGARLIVTVDTGITANAEIAHARALGLDLIVTDHHQPGPELPPAYAVVNPKQAGCLYPHKQLCGVGVAFKLACALADRLGLAVRPGAEFTRFLEEALGLLALATVADNVPLLDENRVFVRYGLRQIARSTNAGVLALLERSNLERRTLSATDIAFRLAPRLNAGGRLGQEDLGIRLLRSRSYAEAITIAAEMEAKNTERQQIDRAVTEAARERVRETIDLDNAGIIVLADPDWHPGVIGIVASRIADEFFRPTVVIALGGPSGRGSARSAGGISIYEALLSCEDLLTTFGGHAFAAGFQVPAVNIPALTERLIAWSNERFDATHFRPRLELEGTLPPAAVTLPLARLFARLAPFGQGNPEPIFATPPVVLAGRPRRFGREDQHLVFHVADPATPGEPATKALAFSTPEWFERLTGAARPFRLAFTPRVNTYRNTETAELVVKDIHTN